MDSRELLSRFLRMETTYEENLQIGDAARRLLAEQQKQMIQQGEWEQKIGNPAIRIFAELSMKNFDKQPDIIKNKISKKVAELRAVATEKDDKTAQLILLRVRGKFEEAKIHPPTGFSYLDWIEAKRK